PYHSDEHTLALAHLDGSTEAMKDDGVRLIGDAKQVDGYFGKGVHLKDGGHINVQLNKQFSFSPNQNFTLELWFRSEKNDIPLFWVNSRWYLRLNAGSNSAIVYFHYRPASKKLALKDRPYARHKIYFHNIPNLSHQWHHVALTHNSQDVLRVYLDGRLAGKQKIPS